MSIDLRAEKLISLSAEKLISLKAASRTLLPQLTDRPISPATSQRWVHRGVLAGDGTRVRLIAVRVGRAFVTTEKAVHDFLQELARRSGVQPSKTKLDGQIQTDLRKSGLI